MGRVQNGACVRRLGRRSMRAARTRNRIAVLAIALTALLFTSLFTIALSINEGFQQNTFRQVGGDFHGTFKNVTEAQMERLRADPLIRESGGRLFLGMAGGEAFRKAHVEVSYMEPACAKHYFCTPEEGSLPREGTDEAAADTRVLELLGVEPKIGAEFTLPFVLDENTEHPVSVERTYTLSGWWAYDPACLASMVVVPRDEAERMAALSSGSEETMTGKWALNVMFRDSFHIEENLKEILAANGYQNESAGEDFIATGVNWGYTGASMVFDFETVVAIGAVLALIVLAGYLIIYNVFQISVTNDVRFYGLLKTVGTTGRQLRKIVRQQALTLSALGIPIGLLLGWLIGVRLTPVIVAQLDAVSVVASANPIIFLGSAAFALLTVLLSCHKPGKMAAKVSPVEAIRRTEGDTVRKKRKKSARRVSPFSMAWANLGRSRRKTAVTVLSLSLAVVLLNLTVAFTNGFDLEKYVSNFVAADFMLGDASYFQVGGELWNADCALSEDAIAPLESRAAAGGRTYGKDFNAQEFIDEDYYRGIWGRWNDKRTLDAKIKLMERMPDGKVADRVQLYGMERFCLGKLNVLAGDLSKLYEPGGRYVAAVYSVGETGEANEGSHWARLGQTVTIRYVEEFEYYNPETGETYPDGMDLTNVVWAERATKYRDIEYEVAALVGVPNPLSYRYYGADEFVMNDQTFLRDSETGGSVMYYACDMADDESRAEAEEFLADFTGNTAPGLDYESRKTYEAEFNDFRRMFLLLGGALSGIVGLVGVLNFTNAVLTGVAARRRELAVLQSAGMTGRQLRAMLVCEGLLYTGGSLVLCLALDLALSPLLRRAMEGMFWFFTYRFTVAPVLLAAPVFAVIGAVVPLLSCRAAERVPIVERLRAVD